MRAWSSASWTTGASVPDTTPSSSRRWQQLGGAHGREKSLAAALGADEVNANHFGVGPGDDLQYILNVQLVLPFRLTEVWNLITRTIAALIYQPELAPGVGDTFSLSISSSSSRSDLFNVQSQLGADRIAVVSASCWEFALAHLAAAGVPAPVDYNIVAVK